MVVTPEGKVKRRLPWSRIPVPRTFGPTLLSRSNVRLRLADSRSLRRVRITGTGEPLCPPSAQVACNARFLPVPPLNASLLRGSACAIPRKRDTRQRIGCPRPMTLRAGLTTPRKAFSMRGKIEGTIGASPSPRVEKRVYARAENMTRLMYEHTRDTSNINLWPRACPDASNVSGLRHRRVLLATDIDALSILAHY